MTVILVQKDPSNLVPVNATAPQRLAFARDFTIYDLNADGTKSAPVGPTRAGGAQAAAAGLAAAPGPAVVTLSADYILKTSDNGKKFVCTMALTITLPVTVYLPDGVFAVPPAAGNLSIASDGTSTLNAATSTLTRTAANNPAGIVIVTHTAAGVAAVSGS